VAAVIPVLRLRPWSESCRLARLPRRDRSPSLGTPCRPFDSPLTTPNCLAVSAFLPPKCWASGNAASWATAIRPGPQGPALTTSSFPGQAATVGYRRPRQLSGIAAGPGLGGARLLACQPLLFLLRRSAIFSASVWLISLPGDPGCQDGWGSDWVTLVLHGWASPRVFRGGSRCGRSLLAKMGSTAPVVGWVCTTFRLSPLRPRHSGSPGALPPPHSGLPFSLDWTLTRSPPLVRGRLERHWPRRTDAPQGAWMNRQAPST